MLCIASAPQPPPNERTDFSSFMIDFTAREFLNVGLDTTDSLKVVPLIITAMCFDGYVYWLTIINGRYYFVFTERTVKARTLFSAMHTVNQVCVITVRVCST